MSPSLRTRLSSWAWRTWTRSRQGYINAANHHFRPYAIGQIHFVQLINHLLFESKCDFQLHEKDALPDIQLLVQVLEA